GGKVVIHDTGAGRENPNPLLLGLPPTSVWPAPGADLDITPPGDTLVTKGPFRTMDNSFLDGALYNARAYVARSNLPANATAILHKAEDTNAIVAFSCPVGLGLVYYSTIPLGFYFFSC